MKADRPSNTARVIAAATILLDCERREPNPVAAGAADLCERFLAEDFTGRLLAASARHPLSRRFWRWLERVTLPGIIDHYWRRKRWIENHCREALADGFSRLVILGAGFDTLGVRLARESSQLEIIEIDHPATQAVKRSAFEQQGMELPSNLSFTGVDLAGGSNALPHSTNRPTIYLMEGVLMYLSKPDVIRLLERIRENPCGRARIIFSCMTRWPDGGSGFRPRSRLIESWLGWCKEPFTWAIAPEQIEDFLASQGLGLIVMTTTRGLSKPSSAEGEPLDGENLVACEPIIGRHTPDENS